LAGTQKGRRPLGRPRRGWVDNIEAGLREIGCGDVDWIDLAWDRGQVKGSCEHGNELSDRINYCGSS
jgi:hypothetical protein